MISKKTLLIENDGLLDLKALIDAYEEIAAAQMQKVRQSVLQSREFTEGVSKIFVEVRRSYEHSLKSSKQEFSVLPHNGRTVAVFISANSGLFGDIVERTFNNFVSFVQQNPGQTDPVIVGKLGLRMLSDRKINLLYNYFDFPDDRVDYEAMNTMMRYLLQYERILIFHGQFRSLVYQEPVTTGVSGHDLMLRKIDAPDQKTAYLFEPSLKEVLQIFEGEILTSIFVQSLHESQLAKFASRMFNLDRAMGNIDTRMQKLANLRRRVEHQIIAKKQLGRLAGLSLWN